MSVMQRSALDRYVPPRREKVSCSISSVCSWSLLNFDGRRKSMFWMRLARVVDSVSASFGSAATAASRASISAWERVSLPLIWVSYRRDRPVPTVPKSGRYALKAISGEPEALRLELDRRLADGADHHVAGGHVDLDGAALRAADLGGPDGDPGGLQGLHGLLVVAPADLER